MKRCIVLCCDSESPYVRGLEVQQTFSGTVRNQVEYICDAGQRSIILERIGPRLYGKLQALLFSSETIENAAPVEPEVKPEDAAELDRRLAEAFAASPETREKA
jgi:hypothetical protein